MPQRRTFGYSHFVLALTLCPGMVLAILPLPSSIPIELGYLRPDWVAMILIYWMLAVPHRIGLVTAWVVGIFMDVLLGNLLGQYALAYVVIGYITLSIYQRMRMFAIWQQSMAVLGLLLLFQLVIAAIGNAAGIAEWRIWYLLPPLSGALLWPLIFMMLRFVRRKLQVI